MRNQFNLFFSLFFFPYVVYAEADPCKGDNMLLSIINRPSFSDSSCTVPKNTLLIEGGFQNQKLIGIGTQRNGPELSARVGLSNNSEFVITPSNYIHQTRVPFSGTTPLWMGIKYRFYYNKNWIISGEGLFSPPSGNENFGSPHSEATINGMISNKLTNELSWQLQMGISTFSDPLIQGGQQFQSINPIFSVSYTLKNISTYIEFVGQSKTSAHESLGIAGGGGIIFLFNTKTTLDMTFYQRITGKFQGFNNLIGVGATHLFG